jgi:uncharacterized protein
MALLMKTECEKCTKAIQEIEIAYICVHECTFCPDCTEAMGHTCPNCGGELVKRPRKTAAVISCSL